MDEATRLVNTIILVGANALAGSSDAPGTMYEEKELPHEKVGLVIGSKGATISQIMQYCGCKININQSSTHGTAHKITYVGLYQQIELAKFLVDMVIEQGTHAMEVYCQSIASDPLVVLETKVATSLLVRTYGQSVFRDVERKYNVRVSFDDSSFDDSACKTSIVGKRSAVNEAAAFLQQFPAEGGAGQREHAESSPGTYSSYPTYAVHQQQQQQQYQLLPQQVPVIQNSYSYLPGASNGLVAVMNPQSFPAVISTATATATVPQVYSSALVSAQQQIASSYQQQPQFQPVQILTSSSQLLALGEDGKAGQLEPPKLLPDGQYQQVAEIKNELVGAFLGKQSVNVNLIRSKSGVLVDVVKPLDVAKGYTHTAILLTGPAANVALAAQMIQEVLINGVTKLLQMPDVVAANPNINMPSGSSPPASLPTSYIAVQGPVPARTAADLSTQQITQPLVDAYAILKPEQVVHTAGYAAQAVAHGSHYQNAVVHVPQNMPAGIVYVQQGAGAGAGYGPAQPQLGQQVQQYGGATIAYQQQPSQQQQQQQQQQLQQQLQQQQLQQQYAAQSVAYSGQYGLNPSTAATMIMMQQPTLQQLQSPQQFQPSQYYQPQPQQQQHSPQYSQQSHSHQPQQHPRQQQQQHYQQAQSRPSSVSGIDCFTY